MYIDAYRLRVALALSILLWVIATVAGCSPAEAAETDRWRTLSQTRLADISEGASIAERHLYEVRCVARYGGWVPCRAPSWRSLKSASHSLAVSSVLTPTPRT